MSSKVILKVLGEKIGKVGRYFAIALIIAFLPLPPLQITRKCSVPFSELFGAVYRTLSFVCPWDILSDGRQLAERGQVSFENKEKLS